MEYRDILWRMLESGIGLLTFNRPEKLNAGNQRMLVETVDVLEKVNGDDAIKVVIITGAGRGFCSGADLTSQREENMFVELGRNDQRRFMASPLSGFGTAATMVARCRVPVIMAVNGIAAGGGLGICLSGDIRIASKEARFSAIFVRRGLSPDTGTTYYLPRIVGSARALELMYTGDIIDAEEALRLGIVSQVVEPTELMPAALTLAERIAAGPSVAIEMTKRLVFESLRNNLETQVAYEAWAIGVAQRTEDAQEGHRSFIEKRQPQFKGR